MPDPAIGLYLSLLENCLTRLAFTAEYRPLWSALGGGLYRRVPIDRDRRAAGRDWPAQAETMVGVVRLEMLHAAARTIFDEGIEGDFMEAGTWRGGAAIFMRAILAAYGDASRVVWVADSFAGLPRPDGRYSADAGDRHWRMRTLAVPLAEVQQNFLRYGLLDDRVKFLCGWFKDTLPAAPIERLALLRLDADMYSSTMDVLESVYGKLSLGGYLIVDDYGALASCRTAVDDFRTRHAIQEPIERIDWTGVFWRKRSPC